MQCNFCGTNNKEGNIYCEYCGKRLGAFSDNNSYNTGTRENTTSIGNVFKTAKYDDSNGFQMAKEMKVDLNKKLISVGILALIALLIGLTSLIYNSNKYDNEEAIEPITETVAEETTESSKEADVEETPSTEPRSYDSTKAKSTQKKQTTNTTETTTRPSTAPTTHSGGGEPEYD